MQLQEFGCTHSKLTSVWQRLILQMKKKLNFFKIWLKTLYLLRDKEEWVRGYLFGHIFNCNIGCLIFIIYILERRSRNSHQMQGYQGSVPNLSSVSGPTYKYHNGPAINKHQRSTSSGKKKKFFAVKS